jgi:hypothetical protein
MYFLDNFHPATRASVISDDYISDVDTIAITDSVAVTDTIVVSDTIVRKDTVALKDAIARKRAVPAKETVSTTPAYPSTNTKRYTIQSGDRLTTIAFNEYGNKVFWIYLYEDNRDKISDPNNISKGIVINIPPASKYGINSNDPASVRKAVERRRDLIKK